MDLDFTLFISKAESWTISTLCVKLSNNVSISIVTDIVERFWEERPNAKGCLLARLEVYQSEATFSKHALYVSWAKTHVR